MNSKMGAALFWGVLFLLLGLGLIIKVVFNLDVPVFRIFIALLLIYLGFRIIVGKSHFQSRQIYKGTNSTVFGERTYSGLDGEENEYNVIFGSNKIDLRNYELGEETEYLSLNTIFGSTTVFLPEDLPVKITVDVAFAQAQLPGKSASFIGSTSYKSDDLEDGPHLVIKADVIFGELDIKRR